MPRYPFSKKEAYSKYRENPQWFFENVIHTQTDNESSLVNSSWKWFWTKYHYNLVENGIMEILMEAQLASRSFTVIDIGVGTGHWVEFYLKHFEIRDIWGVDFCKKPLAGLKKKIPKRVRLVKWDITKEVPPELQGKSFDVVNAIGVMFHIVDDAKWVKAFNNLMSIVNRKGIAIFGGDFGKRTVERGVMRRNRSLATWRSLCQRMGRKIFAVKRFHWWAGADNNGITDNLLAVVPK